MAATRRRRRPFGSVRQLASGRYQARYRGPDGRAYTGRRPDGRALTFSTKGAADAFLAGIRTDIERSVWISPDAPRRAEPPTLRTYAQAWLRERDLADRSREHYEQLLHDHILPTFGDVQVTAITPGSVRLWHAHLAETTGPTAKAHSYSLVRTILSTAVSDELISANPCRIRGGGEARRASRTELPTLPELEIITEHTPPRFRAMVVLAAWCGLRFGELAELRRGDVDVKAGVVHVRRGVVRTRDGRKVKAPKSTAGARTVAIPPHIVPDVQAHFREHVALSRDSLLFPARGGGHLASSSLTRWWDPARRAAGRPDLRFHDLRHFAGTMAAVSGATLRETMSRLGHSTPGAALRYQAVAADRDRVIAAALSDLAKVTPINEAQSGDAQSGGAR